MAAVRTLNANGYFPKVIAPSTSIARLAPSYFDPMIRVPGVLSLLNVFSYHRYRGASEADIHAIYRRAKKYNLSAGMLEHVGGDFHELHEDIKVGNISSWQQYGIAYTRSGKRDRGAYYLLADLKNSANPDIYLARRTRFLAQYFKFIRIGAVRIGAKTNDASKNPVAFINPNGKYIVVVKAKSPGPISIGGLPSGTYGVSYTTARESSAEFKNVVLKNGGKLTSAIPAKGVVTFYQK